MKLTRNEQLLKQAARNKALAEEYALEGDAKSFDFWMRQSAALLAELA
jgi:hypothetical protein